MRRFLSRYERHPNRILPIFGLALLLPGCTTTLRGNVGPTWSSRGGVGVEATVGLGIGLTNSFERKAREEEQSALGLVAIDVGGSFDAKRTSAGPAQALVLFEGLEIASVGRRPGRIGYRGGIGGLQRIRFSGENVPVGGRIYAAMPFTVLTGEPHASSLFAIGPALHGDLTSEKVPASDGASKRDTLVDGRVGASLSLELYQMGFWGIY